MAGVVGRTSRKSDKFWRDALMIASKRTVAETEHLIADKAAPMIARAAALCVQAAGVDGDVAAMKELGDRLDGKPAQAVEHSGPDGNEIPVGVKVSFVNGTDGPRD